MATWPPQVGDRVVYNYEHEPDSGRSPKMGDVGVVNRIEGSAYIVEYDSEKVCGSYGMHLWSSKIEYLSPTGTDVRFDLEEKIKLKIAELESQRDGIDKKISDLRKELPEVVPTGPAIRHLDLDD
jgi:hypothetical protein